MTTKIKNSVIDLPSLNGVSSNLTAGSVSTTTDTTTNATVDIKKPNDYTSIAHEDTEFICISKTTHEKVNREYVNVNNGDITSLNGLYVFKSGECVIDTNTVSAPTILNFKVDTEITANTNLELIKIS